MNLDKLNHSLTPLFLGKVNAAIAVCVAAEPAALSTEQFHHLISLRHSIVLRELRRLSDDERSAFAENELTINRELEALALELKLAAKEEIVGFSRAQKAAKRYKK
ncbi:hypothetical protein [Alteromonas macleodii]|uniref:Uncharacterized protein n=1 Tax=Alteromonas macleodii TaxID=28108 RepID=A0A6T9XWV5_ALTMA|nr:hypothetical protein [Alteromonas macleodii]CAB9493032.1 conserved protein of unknown function [Alteromonas macleodii]